MTHDSTWIGRNRGQRWTRLTTPVGFLLVCVLLAALPATASASAPEMKGEWELLITSPSGPARGTALITQEANAKGEFSTNNVLFSGVVHGTFSGTLEGSKASVTITAEAASPYPASSFASTEMTVNSGIDSLSMTGPGTFMFGSTPTTATLKATRLRTYKQIEEQEEREEKEREEHEARARVRGEWAISLQEGPQTAKGTALIAEEANAKNEFASSGALFEGVIPGTFSGTLEGNEASVTVTTEAAGPYPAGTFTATKIVVAFTNSSMSMTGSGTIKVEGNSIPATLTATRILTHQQVVERENTERAAKEKQEKEAQEAKEKVENEAKEKVAREAKAAQEAKEKQEKAVPQKVPPPSNPGVSIPPLVSAEASTKSSTVGSGGSIVLALENPNTYAVQGDLSLTFTKVGKSSAAKHKASKKQTVSAGSASFSLSSKGSSSLTIKLSSSVRAELAHHKTLHVVLTVTTKASGQTTTTKTFGITLHAAKPAHGKH
jgi:hypothetical protein